LAVIIRLIKRKYLFKRVYDEDNISLEPTTTGTTVYQAHPSEAYEMSNMAPPVYPVIQMTTGPNGQPVFVQQFPVAPQQLYTNAPNNVVYVTGDPSGTFSPVYMATNPMPPQY